MVMSLELATVAFALALAGGDRFGSWRGLLLCDADGRNDEQGDEDQQRTSPCEHRPTLARLFEVSDL